MQFVSLYRVTLTTPGVTGCEHTNVSGQQQQHRIRTRANRALVVRYEVVWSSVRNQRMDRQTRYSDEEW